MHAQTQHEKKKGGGGNLYSYWWRMFHLPWIIWFMSSLPPPSVWQSYFRVRNILTNNFTCNTMLPSKAPKTNFLRSDTTSLEGNWKSVITIHKLVLLTKWLQCGKSSPFRHNGCQTPAFWISSHWGHMTTLLQKSACKDHRAGSLYQCLQGHL